MNVMKKYASVVLSVLILLGVFFLQQNREDTAPLSERDPAGNAAVIPFSDKTPRQVLPLSPDDPIAPIDPLPLPPEVLSTSSHAHAWRLVKNESATCFKEGETVWICACGQTARQTVPLLSHTYSPADCDTPETCSVCGAVHGRPLGHSVSGTVCTRCQKTFSEPVFVCNREFSFFESAASVVQKMGKPTEILNENGYASFIYFREDTPFTVFQFCDDTLAGVFSFDPSLRFHMADADITMQNFQGTPDPNSDACTSSNSIGKTYGFFDDLNGGSCYALWLYQGRLDYDYINNPRLYQDYSSQARLMFYLVNALRNRAHLASLIWSPSAAEVASEYCAYMEKNNFFAHDHSYSDRLTEKGILWSFSGENLSQGYFHAFFVSDAYYHSSSHRANILNGEYTHIGTAFERVETILTVYGSQVFYS